MTRPDIAFSVQTLSQFLQNPKKSHMKVAISRVIVRHVKNQSEQGILLSSSSNENINVYCAAWASCPQTRRFVVGYFVKIGDFVVYILKAKKIVFRSSTEAGVL